MENVYVRSCVESTRSVKNRERRVVVYVSRMYIVVHLAYYTIRGCHRKLHDQYNTHVDPNTDTKTDTLEDSLLPIHRFCKRSAMALRAAVVSMRKSADHACAMRAPPRRSASRNWARQPETVWYP